MTQAADFQALVEAYGADPRRWPADRRAGAEAFIASAPEAAKAILAFEAALDEAMDVLRPPVPDAALRARVLAAAPKPRAKSGAGAARGLFDWLRPGIGALMAASCVAGVVAGLALVQPGQRNDLGGEAVMAALSGPGDSADDDSSEVG